MSQPFVLMLAAKLALRFLPCKMQLNVVFL